MEVNGLVVTVLKKGSYFGEIGLLRNCRRTASIRALSETCDLFVLTKVCADTRTSVDNALQVLARWLPGFKKLSSRLVIDSGCGNSTSNLRKAFLHGIGLPACL